MDPAYLYHQNDALNADTWNRKRLGRRARRKQVLPEPELKTIASASRRVARSGRTVHFIFGSYEGRRFPSSVDVLRIVPTPSLRSGALRFRDAGNNIVSYNLGNSTGCGPTAASLCDPRGIGLNPVVNDLWQFLPAGNDPTVGDGLNTIGFRSTASAATTSDFAVLRLDHNFTEKWRFDGSYRYSRQNALSPTQIDIGGLLQGDSLGKASSLGKVPVQPRFVVGGLTGQLTSTLVNEFRFSFQRNYWFIQRTTPFPQVPTTNVSLQVSGAAAAGAGLLDQPIDVHTQLARIQGVNDRIFQYIDNLTWVKGSHSFNFGASFRRLNLYHLRNDKVVGSLSALVAELDDGQAMSIPGTNRPRDCSATVTTNCLQSGDVTRWNRLYAGALGMVDNIGAMIVRDGSLTAKPIGTPIEIDAKVNAYEFYMNDAWRFKPSLTLTLGLSYQWQTPPVEKEGKQTFLVDQTTGEIITSRSYLAARRQAAEAGDIYNPNLAFQPINNSKRKTIFDIDRKNLGPRLARAWNPSFQGGWFGSLFGDKKTVVRGGYSLVFDRVNTVQTVVIPALGVGFAQTVNCRGPRIGGACGNSNDPTNAFRIGVDGAAPIPPIPAVTSPVVPTVPFGELLSFQVDPDITVGRSHSIDLSVQRELFGKLLLEFGYTGRFGQNLNQNVQINAVPFFMKDKGSGQTFAQAFDAVAAQVRANAAVTPQPWFENQIGAGGTNLVAGSQSAAFRDGLVNDLWTFIQFVRPGGPIGNLQVLDLWMRTDGGRSNYNAFFVTLRRRFSGGLTFDVNYTLSRALDQAGLIQNFIGTFSSPYDPDIDYGPAFFDRTHVLNANWFYELPFGSGRRWSLGNPVNKVISGWFVSGIYTANTGLPLTVAQSNQVWGGDPLNFSVAAGAIPNGKLNLGNTIHTGVKGSAGIGTNSDSATGGTGMNLFGDPEAAFNAFRKIRISEDGRQGSGVLRGLSRWNVDLSIGKKTQITERIRTIFSADFLNLTNRLELNDPVLSLQNPAAFGVLTTQFNTPRTIQLGFRVEF